MTNYELLSKFGFDYISSTLVMTTFVGSTPENANPDAETTRKLVLGIQNFLNDRFSARLPQTGVIDATTAATIDKFHGPGWQLLYWSQVYDKLYYVAEIWAKLQGEYKPPAIPDPTKPAVVPGTSLTPPASPTGGSGPLGIPWSWWLVGGAVIAVTDKKRKRGRR